MRKTAIKRHAWIGQGKPRKPLPKVNVERQAKRAIRYSAGLKRYRKSLCYLLVCDRARGRCEYVVDGQRCETREGLQHHHRTYVRFGGDELPADMLVLCAAHHHAVEGAKPHKQRRRGA